MNKVTLDCLTKKYYEDETFRRKLDDSPSIDEADVTQYDAIYFTGDHGVVYDFRGHDTIARAVNDIYDCGVSFLQFVMVRVLYLKLSAQTIIFL